MSSRPWRRLRFALRAAISALLLLAAGGATWQAAMTRRDLAQHPPPGRYVDVGDRRLHLHCTGRGAPTIILEAGLGNDVNHWARVQPMLASFARVCSYDRAGLGWSDPGPMPRVAERIVDDLGQLLDRSGESGPFVLVGHSNGGVYVRLFAARRPRDVVGLVLVDPNTELIDPCPPLPAAQRLTYASLVALAPLGAPRALLPVLFPLERSPLPPEVRSRHGALRARTAAVRTLWSETQAICSMLAAMRAAPALPPALPIILLSTAERPAAQRQVAEYHRRMAASWPRGTFEVVSKSGHWIQIDRPEVVVAAVQRVIAGATAESGDRAGP